MLAWHALANKTAADLAEVDLAEMNLACAYGLPGAREMNPSLCFDKIEKLTDFVRTETERVRYDFGQNPIKYRNSEAYFRTAWMITLLQRDCGIRYNPMKIFANAKFIEADSFLFGIFQGGGGTCATLPVLYTTIGRRLGYPIKLVSTWEHLFARWDSPNGERFNIEATNKGLLTPPDDYYRKGIYKRTAKIEKKAGNMISMTPQMELANFLRLRALYWHQHGYHRNAAHVQAWATEIAGNQMMHEQLYFFIAKWQESLKSAEAPAGLRHVLVEVNKRRFQTVPWEAEKTICFLEVKDDVYHDPVRRLPFDDPVRVTGSNRVPSGIQVAFKEAANFLDNHPRR